MTSTTLIGRAREVDELDRRLRSVRLVTLVGPGGIGKTTVALAVAERVAPRFARGVHFVDLTRVDEGDAVAGTLAAQLGFPSFEALVSGPTDQPALIVLDNCEHVLDDVADVVAELLDACADPTVLATSRSPLDLPGEAVVPLGPLAVPPRGLVEPDAPALALFRARAHGGRGATGADQLAVMAEVCRALDGVPLAIEIAAARTRVLTPAEILARLGDLDLLSRPRHRGRDRHRSLRATIEWSYDQLDAADQSFFDRLAVFAGDFTCEGAHAVASDQGSEPATVDRLSRLVDVSLVTAEPVGNVTRFRLLGALRTFARERLEARGEWDATWQRFVDHVTAWSVAAATAGAERWDGSILGDMLARFDSHLAALRWCIEHDGSPDRSCVLLATLWAVVHQGHAEEVERLAQRALERWPEPTAAGWADAAATAATCRYLLGRPDDAIALATRALADAVPSAYSPVTLRRVVAQSRAARGELVEAIGAADDAIAFARRSLPSLAMELEVFRAELAANLGAVDESLARVRAVRDEALAAGSELNAVWARSVEASLLLRTDIDGAVAVATEALARAVDLAYPACESVNLHTLADAALARGDLAGAARRTLTEIEHLVAHGAETELRNALRAAAVIAARSGRAGWADLAATAASLPAVSIFSIPGFERQRLPDAAVGTVLARREALVRARELLAAVRDDAGPVVEVTRSEPVIDLRSGVVGATLRRSGDVWEATWAGHTVSLRHAKGLEDLARLLAAPGKEVHCLDLAGAGAEQSSTGEVIDATARATYERRIRELQEEIDEAEANVDVVRAERAQAESDALVDHLTVALGLGRTTRQAGSTVERARSAVTQRLRSTIRRIGVAHDELGRHLDASVRTGTYCVYRPERPTTWTIR